MRKPCFLQKPWETPSVQTVVLRSFLRELCPLKWGWCTYQEPPAVPEPPAPVLPSQHEREGLTRKKWKNCPELRAELQHCYKADHLGRDTDQVGDATHRKVFIIRTDCGKIPSAVWLRTTQLSYQKRWVLSVSDCRRTMRIRFWEQYSSAPLTFSSILSLDWALLLKGEP